VIRTHRGLLTAILIPTRSSANATAVLGDDSTPNRVDVTAWITRVDASAQTVSVSISDVVPVGSLADDAGYFRDGAKLYSTTALQNES
jgi:hypothetical protein